MTKLLDEAMAKVATLPPATQEKIGEELIAHVDKMERLRGELQKGVRSLERGEGKELDMTDVIKRARAQHDEQ
jgi:hypothetical protein